MKNRLLLLILPILLTSIAMVMTGVNVGEKAPVFKAVDSQGKEWSLKNHLGKNYVVLYFYPAAMTGGCTQQACSYRDNMNEFDKVNAKVVGISGDQAEGLRLFKQEYNLNFDLLSDSDGAIAKMYGVPVNDGGTVEKTIGGKNVSFIRDATTARWTFVIDKKGTLIYKKADVNAGQDSEEVIAAIKKHMEG